jgi:hypothetical protein
MALCLCQLMEARGRGCWSESVHVHCTVYSCVVWEYTCTMPYGLSLHKQVTAENMKYRDDLSVLIRESLCARFSFLFSWGFRRIIITDDEYIDWRWPLSCVHSAMIVFSTQLAEGGGASASPTPFTLSIPSNRYPRLLHPLSSKSSERMLPTLSHVGPLPFYKSWSNFISFIH